MRRSKTQPIRRPVVPSAIAMEMKPFVEIACSICGRTAAFLLHYPFHLRGSQVVVECPDGHRFTIPGDWLVASFAELAWPDQTRITVPRRFSEASPVL